MGTVTAPAQSVAKSVMVHSGRFSEKMTSLSPWPRPRSARPRDRCLTRRANSSVEMGV